MPRPCKLAPEKEQEIVTRFNKGELTTPLANEYGVHPDTVRNAVRRAGFSLTRGPGGVLGAPRRVAPK